ncbi:MAG: hypothetical protein DRP87_12735 [Spirochaetes bacterium]|nr:MAG: hypothetical protein DRP87_12735 [Spirochaetota bacterium]
MRYPKRTTRASCILTVFIFLFLPFSAEEAFPEELVREIISEVFWCELEPIIQEDEEYPPPRDQMLKQILAEAQFVFSGMIYGFRFVYTPLDLTRNVEEVFILEPLSRILWGDKNLKVESTRTDDDRLYARVRYRLADFQQDWLKLWESTTLPTASGTGRGDLFGGYKEKFTALRQGIKQAIRDYLRERVFNKPKEIRGEVLLMGAPYTIIDSGTYSAKVKIKLKIDEIVPYTLF